MLAETCLSLLRNAHPLHTIFGPYYKPETAVQQRIRSLLPSPVQPNIPSTSIGIRMERQQYFTNPELREDLMRWSNVRSCFPVKPEGWMSDHQVGYTQKTSSDQHVRERRQRTIARVESAIRSHFGQDFHIGAFGSTQYGVDGKDSDLDLVIIVGILFF